MEMAAGQHRALRSLYSLSPPLVPLTLTVRGIPPPFALAVVLPGSNLWDNLGPESRQSLYNSLLVGS